MPTQVWLICFTLGLVAGVAPVAAAGPSRPNVIVIVLDDLGARDLGCYGSRFHETPRIDDLASRGMRFTDAYAACPVCSPSRAAIMTGKYPARLHLTDWLPGRADRNSQKLLRPTIRQELPLEERTLAEALRSAGYVCASIGKWHLGSADFWPKQQGFDINLGGTETGSPPGGYFRFKTPSLSARDDSEYLTDRLSDEAVAFIKQYAYRPFFLYLAHYAVHIPLQGKPALLAKYRAKPAPAMPGAGEPAQANAIYAAMLESADIGVGRIMDTLNSLKIADRTVIVFTSDNGGLSVKEGPNTPATSNAPLRAGKGYLYEGGIRVPLLIAWPGVARAGSMCSVPVSGQDLYPTILAMAGVDVRAGQEIDGVSLVPFLKGGVGVWRYALFWHYPHYSNQGGKPGGAIRQNSLKFIEWYEGGPPELYDLANDVGERQNLAAQRPQDVARLGERLAQWRAEVGAQMPKENPAYMP
jgi:arylsulfatase A